MTLPAEFYELINSVDNFGKLPDDDPLVIRVRELALKTSSGKPKLRKKNSFSKEVMEVLNKTTRYNLSSNRYLYLMQHDVPSKYIYEKIGTSVKFLERWVFYKELTRTKQRCYHLLDGNRVVTELEKIADLDDYLSLSPQSAHRFFAQGGDVPGGYKIVRVFKYEPKIGELNDFDEEDTFGYWYDKRPSRKGLAKNETNRTAIPERF